MTTMERIRAELADLYVAKFQELGLAENKGVLTLLLDLKYEEIKWAILEAEDETRHIAHLDERHRLGALTFLRSLGALPTPDDPPPF